MSKPPRSAPAVPTDLLEPTSTEPPRQAEGHDEWLLDEALAETFPASDSIAVSSIHRLRANPLRRSGKFEGSDRMSDVNIGRDKSPNTAALETPFECDQCHTGIAAIVALSFEGADYVYHFCGPRCFKAWSEAEIVRDK